MLHFSDVLIVVGDNVAHDIDARHYDDQSLETKLKTYVNLAATNEIVAKYFHDTTVVNAIGNNDGHYHDMASPDDEKAGYYKYLWELWFEG